MVARTLVAVIFLASLAGSGCLGDNEQSGLAGTPRIWNQSEATSHSLPPCTLKGGSFTVPPGEGASVPTLPTQATIKTDAFGVSHIYADDAYSLFYANGYVQARDRLFQLDVLRHVGYGNSASVIGPGQLASDAQVVRDLYSVEEMEAQFDAVAPELQEVLRAYSDGVNRYIVEATAGGVLPAEFLALGHIPEPWTPIDSVSVINYLIGYFGVAGGAELGNAQRLAQLQAVLGEQEGWKAFEDLNWLVADQTYTTIPVSDKHVNGCEAPPKQSAVPTQQLALVAAASGAGSLGVLEESSPLPASLMTGRRTGSGLFEGFHWGSNALLIDGTKTTTGQPIMFGAPQMGYYKPPVPYQIGLHGAGFDAAGFGVAGAPGIVIGRNNDITWSVTSGIDDQVDTIAVPITPDGTYTWDGQAKQAQCRDVEHSVGPNLADVAAGIVTPPTTYTQRVCRIEGMPVVALNQAAGVAWVQRTTTRNEELGGAWMWLNVARQTGFDDVRTLLASFPFTFNFHVAWDDGIGYLHTGNVPLRAQGIDPRLPAPAGSLGAWQGEAYTAQLDTWHTDPSTGYYANWNNAPVFGWRTGDSLQNWGTAHRVQTLDTAVRERLAATNDQLSWEEVRLINELSASRDSYAAHFVPYFIQAAQRDATLAPMAAVLQDWLDAGLPWRDADGDGSYDDPAHAIYDVAIGLLMASVLQDELGDLAPTLHLDPIGAGDPHAGDHGKHDNDYSVLANALAGRSKHDWCDDVTTTKRESCTEHLRRALDGARDFYSLDADPNPATWRTPVHYSQFTPIGGTNADKIPMVNRGSWVQVVAVGQGLEYAKSSLPPSNSGLITGPELALVLGAGFPEPARLTSELQMYVDFAYKPFPLTPSEVDSVGVSTETLVIVPPVRLPLP